MEKVSKARMQALWDNVAEYGASRTEAALQLLLQELAAMVGAQNGYWMGTLRVSDIADSDPVYGWRPRAVTYLHPSPEREAAKKEHIRRINNGQINPTIVRNLERAGEYRVNISHEMAPKDWYESEFYQTLIAPLEIVDTLYVVTPLGHDLESWLAFERIGSDKHHFGEREREIISSAVRPLKWFHQQLILHHGVRLAEDPLVPAERRVLNKLLTDMTEQEIAEELGLTRSTVHTYCTRIYRKFNVRGRVGLSALWLGEST